MTARHSKTKIGLSGTGFIAKGLVTLLGRPNSPFEVNCVLTRRPLGPEFDAGFDANFTNDPDHLARSCDIVVECSGSVGGATRVALATMRDGVPLVTLNAEFQVTLGSYFSDSPLIREARGDQPGSLAALDHEVRAMGFDPLVYASQKGFLDPNPSPEQMQYWAHRQGISVAATTSFTDGTKVQIEQALVANGLGAVIVKAGLTGQSAPSLMEGGVALAQRADQLGAPVSDYVLMAGGRGEVFIVARHEAPPEHLRYYKLGDGPYYLIERPFHLGHFEVPLTLEDVVNGRPAQLTGGQTQQVSVAALAKRDLPAGFKIDKAIGSFNFRGSAVETLREPEHVPIGLMEHCTLIGPLKASQMVLWKDVEFSDDVAMKIARAIYPVGAP
jgi:predicted homoserine dehydrogenase-like protein